MKATLRALSALLGYPSVELQAHIGEIRAALASERVLSRSTLDRLQSLLAFLDSADLLDAQAAYSDLFDRSPALSLHLFEHVYGDSRERGSAMVELGQLYLGQGFVMSGNELPDYLPLFLEFASCLPEREAQELVSQPAHVLAAFEQRLAGRGSAYAAVFHALLTAVGAKPNPDAVAELRSRETETKSLDEQWEDVPVDFSRPLPAARGAAGVVARIRAAQRAVVGAFKA
jgi:nitrate reductase delta subunit